MKKQHRPSVRVVRVQALGCRSLCMDRSLELEIVMRREAGVSGHDESEEEPEQLVGVPRADPASEGTTGTYNFLGGRATFVQPIAYFVGRQACSLFALKPTKRGTTDRATDGH